MSDRPGWLSSFLLVSKRLVSPRKSSINSDGINEPPIEGIYDGIGVYPSSFGDGGMHEPSSGTAI